MKRLDDEILEGFYEARGDGRAVECRAEPADLDEALAMQLQIAGRFTEAGDPIAAWKVGLTSGVALNALGTGVRPFGYVIRSRLFESGATIRHEGDLALQIEPELCLILGAPLRGAEVSPDEVRAATKAVAAAIEINEFRVPGKLDDPYELIVDGLANWGVVVGERAAPDTDLEGLTVEVVGEDGPVAKAVRGVDVELDDPFLSVSRLCAALDRLGMGLESDQPIITGSFAHIPAGPGRWTCRFAGIGECTLAFES